MSSQLINFPRPDRISNYISTKNSSKRDSRSQPHPYIQFLENQVFKMQNKIYNQTEKLQLFEKQVRNLNIQKQNSKISDDFEKIGKLKKESPKIISKRRNTESNKNNLPQNINLNQINPISKNQTTIKQSQIYSPNLKEIEIKNTEKIPDNKTNDLVFQQLSQKLKNTETNIILRFSKLGFFIKKKELKAADVMVQKNPLSVFAKIDSCEFDLLTENQPTQKNPFTIKNQEKIIMNIEQLSKDVPQIKEKNEIKKKKHLVLN